MFFQQILGVSYSFRKHVCPYNFISSIARQFDNVIELYFPYFESELLKTPKTEFLGGGISAFSKLGPLPLS